MSVDHYNTLGVISTASAADLRAAYLKLARANHPDKFDGSARAQAEIRMQQINEAWNVLGVKHKRREYDAKQPKNTSRPGASGAAAPGASGGRRGHAHFRPFDDEPLDRADIDLDATPIPGSKQIPRWVAFLPVAFFTGGLVTLVLGALVNTGSVFAFGVMMLLLAGVCFIMLPLFVMSRAERDPDL